MPNEFTAVTLPWLEQRFRLSRPKEILYHYTQTGGLLGIVQSGKLRASDVLYLNDASELEHARGVIHAVLRKAVYATTDQPDRALLGTMLDGWEDDPPVAEVYAFCLTENGDQLSQWRAYGGSAGYSIGFRTANWHTANFTTGDPDEWMLRLGKVIYDPRSQRAAVKELLARACRFLREQLRGGPMQVQQYQEFILTVNWLLLTHVTAFFKNSTFREEQEWRLIRARSTRTRRTRYMDYPVTFRAGSMGLIPYIDLQLRVTAGPPLPLAVVRHGPTPNPPLSQSALRRYLSSKNYGRTPVGGSTIPLRV
jgi:Protein of unknown function (DUF2971)